MSWQQAAYYTAPGVTMYPNAANKVYMMETFNGLVHVARNRKSYDAWGSLIHVGRYEGYPQTFLWTRNDLISSAARNIPWYSCMSDTFIPYSSTYIALTRRVGKQHSLPPGHVALRTEMLDHHVGGVLQNLFEILGKLDARTTLASLRPMPWTTQSASSVVNHIMTWGGPSYGMKRPSRGAFFRQPWHQGALR